jgi:hypothetical protein
MTDFNAPDESDVASTIRAGTSSGTATDAPRIKFNNSFYTSWSSVRDAFHKLKNRAGSKWGKINAVDQPDGSFQLRCECGQSCQLGNPSQFFKKHTCKQNTESTCNKKPKGVPFLTCSCDRRASYALLVVPLLNHWAWSCTSGPIHAFAAAKNQSEEFNKELLKAIVTGGVSFAFVENEHLRKAAKIVGVDLPSRKQLSGGMLDALFEDTQLVTRASISNMEFPAGASDGWRKKYAQQGDSLMNFTVMGNEGECQTSVYAVSCHSQPLRIETNLYCRRAALRRQKLERDTPRW